MVQEPVYIEKFRIGILISFSEGMTMFQAEVATIQYFVREKKVKQITIMSTKSSN